MLRAFSALCLVAAFALAGCGDSGSGAAGDPASLVPADALVYGEVVVQPEGDLREGALAAAGKLMQEEDAGAKIRSLINEALAGENMSWERDFEPWLGERAGIWATNFEAAEPSWAVIVEATDEEAAKAAFTRFAETDDEPHENRTHEGVEYEVDADGVGGGVVDGRVVFGTEDAVKRTIETRDGSKLADADRYKSVVDELEDDRLGHMWIDSKAFLALAKAGDPAAAQSFEQLKPLIDFDKLGATAFSFQADGDGLQFDTLTTGVEEGPMSELLDLTGFSGSELLGELPGDAWAAWAIPHLGETAKKLYSTFAGALGGVAISAQIQEATGLSLEQDVFSWIGDVGVYASGTDMATLDGAVVIESTDDAKAGTAFGKLVALVGTEGGVTPEPIQVAGAESAFAISAPGADKRVVLARGTGRVVVAYGEEAAAAALAPDAKLADSDNFGAAEELLDMKPAFLLSIPEAIALADALGATADPEFDEARPYLEALGVLAAGGELDGDTLRSRLAVGLR